MEEANQDDTFVSDGLNPPPRVMHPIRKPHLSRYSSYSKWMKVPTVTTVEEPETTSDGWEYDFTAKFVIWYMEEDAENQKVWNEVPQYSRYKNTKWCKNRLFLDSKSMRRLKSRFTPLVLDVPLGFQSESKKHWEQLYSNIANIFSEKREHVDDEFTDETSIERSQNSQEAIFLGFHVDDMTGAKEPVYFDPFLYKPPVQFRIPKPGKYRKLPSPEHILEMLPKIESSRTPSVVA